jgi:hypothetical protein
MDEATDINTSTSTSSRPDLRHVLAGFHKLRRTRPPIPRSPPEQKRSPTLSHFLPLKKLLIKGGVLLRRSIGGARARNPI